MEKEIILGTLGLAAWAAAALWGLWRMALSARRQPTGSASSFLSGLLGGCAFGVGMVLCFKNSLPYDLFGPGFILAGAGGLWIWLVERDFPAIGAPSEPSQRPAERRN